MGVNNDVFMIETEKCEIPFLDCRGYYDLAAEIIVTIIATLTLIKALHNHHELKLELRASNQEDTGMHLRRKIVISFINAAYMSSILVHLVFSMLLFTVANEEKIKEDGSHETGVQIILETKLNLWYQFTHLLVVQLLNCLVVIIGKLYWNSLNSFYSLKALQTPFLYRSCHKYLIYSLIVFQGGVVIAALIDSIFDFQGLQIVLNWLVLASQILSTAFFLIYRILYHKNIFSSVKLGKKTVQRQQIYNVIIIITALGRVVLCILESLSVSFETLRNYDVKSKCHDTWPYHSIVMLFSRVIVDILPAFIFIQMFGPQNRSRSNSNIEQTLFSRGLSESSGI